jgi:hypothetical protein
MVVAVVLPYIRLMGIYDGTLAWSFEVRLQPGDDLVQSDTLLEIGKDERTLTTHETCISIHHF